MFKENRLHFHQILNCMTISNLYQHRCVDDLKITSTSIHVGPVVLKLEYDNEFSLLLLPLEGVDGTIFTRPERSQHFSIVYV